MNLWWHYLILCIAPLVCICSSDWPVQRGSTTPRTGTGATIRACKPGEELLHGAGDKGRAEVGDSRIKGVGRGWRWKKHSSPFQERHKDNELVGGGEREAAGRARNRAMGKASKKAKASKYATLMSASSSSSSCQGTSGFSVA